MKKDFFDRLKNEKNLTDEEIDALLEDMYDELFIKDSYGLKWKEEKDLAQLQMENGQLITKHVSDKQILKDKNKNNNLLIEGDNLHSLQMLKNSGQKVEFIYIDPPYNTGGTDFIYKDGWKHTEWLNFMKPRLELARDLLTDDGVIFVSIDDNEQANLKLLMDEVFGNKNFIGQFIVENNPKGRKNNKFISYTHEYCIVYAKNYNQASNFKKTIPHQNDNRPILVDEKGMYKHGKRQIIGVNSNPEITNDNKHRVFIVLYHKKNNNLIIKTDCINDDLEYIRTPEIAELIKKGYNEYVPLSSKTKKINTVTYTKEKFLDLYYNNDLIFKENSIYSKDRNINTQIKSILNKSNLSNLDILTETSNAMLEKILGYKKFENPKNVNLIKSLLKLYNNQSAIILDFFAGSGTTGQAVMELNEEDGGNRKFILCTNNENNICEDITYVRNKCIIEGETVDKKPIHYIDNKVFYSNKDLEDYYQKYEKGKSINLKTLIGKNETTLNTKTYNNTDYIPHRTYNQIKNYISNQEKAECDKDEDIEEIMNRVANIKNKIDSNNKDDISMEDINFIYNKIEKIKNPHFYKNKSITKREEDINNFYRSLTNDIEKIKNENKNNYDQISIKNSNNDNSITFTVVGVNNNKEIINNIKFIKKNEDNINSMIRYMNKNNINLYTKNDIELNILKGDSNFVIKNKEGTTQISIYIPEKYTIKSISINGTQKESNINADVVLKNKPIAKKGLPNNLTYLKTYVLPNGNVSISNLNEIRYHQIVPRIMIKNNLNIIEDKDDYVLLEGKDTPKYLCIKNKVDNIPYDKLKSGDVVYLPKLYESDIIELELKQKMIDVKFYG